MMFVLVWLVWFLLFTLPSDSVSTSEHGHRAYVVPKAKLLYHRPQVHKADHHVWQSYCNEDPTERGRRELPDTRGTQCEELGLFPVGRPHCAFSLCKKPEGGTPEGLHEKLPAETSSCGPGVYELQWSCGQWMKLPSQQISKYKIMCNIDFFFNYQLLFCVVLSIKEKKCPKNKYIVLWLVRHSPSKVECFISIMWYPSSLD